jgi:hypothetical protein
MPREQERMVVPTVCFLTCETPKGTVRTFSMAEHAPASRRYPMVLAEESLEVVPP